MVHYIVLWFTRFKEGLSTLGVLNAMTVYPDAFRPAFCIGHNRLTASSVDELFRPQFSAEGNNKRATETAILAWWKDFLQDVEGTGRSYHICA